MTKKVAKPILILNESLMRDIKEAVWKRTAKRHGFGSAIAGYAKFCLARPKMHDSAFKRRMADWVRANGGSAQAAYEAVLQNELAEAINADQTAQQTDIAQSKPTKP